MTNTKKIKLALVVLIIVCGLLKYQLHHANAELAMHKAALSEHGVIAVDDREYSCIEIFGGE